MRASLIFCRFGSFACNVYPKRASYFPFPAGKNPNLLRLPSNRALILGAPICLKSRRQFKNARMSSFSIASIIPRTNGFWFRKVMTSSGRGFVFALAMEIIDLGQICSNTPSRGRWLTLTGTTTSWSSQNYKVLVSMLRARDLNAIGGMLRPSIMAVIVSRLHRGDNPIALRERMRIRSTT
jgi:hypothetical protein